MKFNTALAAAVAAAATIGIVGAPLAAADDPTTTTIGNEAKLTDGSVVQGWTISDLKTSTDAIPYPVAGTLWEATATDQAITGSATPIVSNLNARSRSGETYRVLFGVATPQGVNPSTLAQGDKTTGKIYFDVIGDSPDSVVYNSGGQDRLVWVEAPPPARGSGGTTPRTPATGGSATPSSSPASATPTSPTPTSPNPTSPAPTTPAPTSSVPATSPVPTPGAIPGAPAGSQGTPLVPGSQGTPLPTGSSGTPAAVGTEGAPQPAAIQEAPAATGSQGTPLPAGSPAPVAPTTTVATAPPAA